MSAFKRRFTTAAWKWVGCSLVDDDLETVEQRKQRFKSHFVIYFTMFLMSLGFSIILTGVWPYLQKMDPQASKIFMGYVVAANPLGQMLFSPLVGWWGNKLSSCRLPMQVTLLLFAFASALYSGVEVMPFGYKTVMITSRILVGVSSANIAVARSYLSAATKLSERTQAVSLISLAQVLGFVVGPALQTAVTPLGNDGFYVRGIPINMYTAPGWINVLMGMLNFALFLPFCFKECKIAAREAMRDQGKASEKETWKSMKPDYLAAWTLICAFFVLVFNFVLLETLGTTLTMEQFAWNKEQSLFYMGLLMSVGAIVACGTFVLIKPLCERFGERQVMLWGGFSLMIIGRVLCIPWGPEPPLIADWGPYGNETRTEDGMEKVGCPSTQEWCYTTPQMSILQFIIGYGFTTIGYPVGVTLIQTIFSKVLGPRPQGVWMGLMTGAGCASRVMGPVFVGMIYANYGTYWTFGITGATLLVSMVWLSLVKDRLVPVKAAERDKIEVPLMPMSTTTTANGGEQLESSKPTVETA